MRAGKLYIDGRFTDATGGATYHVPNPATEETIGHAADAGVADMAAAIAAARRAFDQGPWPTSSRDERARALLRIADVLERRKEELRALVVAEAGATAITHGMQVDAPIDHLRYWAEQARTFPFEEPLPPRANQGAFGPQVSCGVAYRQPVGVCAMIPTWNFPAYVTVQKLGPALATGCTMVFKPSPWTPLVGSLLAEVVAEADLPPGVVNVVTGTSPQIGEALVSDARVDKISFTGSVQTGRRILAAAAPRLARVHLELGGKSVGIYLDADDIGMNAIVACGPAMFHAGQGCAMATRVLVRREAHDAFVEQMAGFLKGAVTVGDPAQPTSMLGPLIRDDRRRAVEEHIASGVAEGAKLVAGGGRPAHCEKGWFLEPTLFAGVRNDMRIAREEIFGPVVSVIPFADEDEAVRIANDSTYGLAGAIYGRDTGQAIALAKRLRTGSVWINGGLNLFDGPFGGFKESGLGREGGRWGMEEYTELQHVAWRA